MISEKEIKAAAEMFANELIGEEDSFMVAPFRSLYYEAFIKGAKWMLEQTGKEGK